MKRITGFAASAAACSAAFLAVSCASGSGDQSVVSVKFNKVQEVPAINISEWCSEPEFIALDSRSNDAFTSGFQFFISDSYIGIGGSTRQPYKIYDRKTGEYLRDIGHQGRGPGEYLNTYSSVIDENTGTVYLLAWNARSILSYDLATGDFKKEYPLKYSVPKGKFAVDTGIGDITVVSLPFNNMVPSVAWKQDKDGNVLWEIPAGHLTVVPDFSNEIYSRFNTGEFDLSILTWGGRSDSLYVVKDDGVLQPVYTIDFNTDEVKGDQYSGTINENAPIHSYTMLPDYFISDVSMPKQLPDGNFTTGKPVYVVTDRQTGTSVKTSFYNDYLAWEMSTVSFQQGYLLSVFSASGFLEFGKKALEEGKLSEASKSKVASILENLQEDGNYVIAISRLKNK